MSKFGVKCIYEYTNFSLGLKKNLRNSKKNLKKFIFLKASYHAVYGGFTMM